MAPPRTVSSSRRFDQEELGERNEPSIFQAKTPTRSHCKPVNQRGASQRTRASDTSSPLLATSPGSVSTPPASGGSVGEPPDYGDQSRRYQPADINASAAAQDRRANKANEDEYRRKLMAAKTDFYRLVDLEMGFPLDEGRRERRGQTERFNFACNLLKTMPRLKEEIRKMKEENQYLGQLIQKLRKQKEDVTPMDVDVPLKQEDEQDKREYEQNVWVIGDLKKQIKTLNEEKERFMEGYERLKEENKRLREENEKRKEVNETRQIDPEFAQLYRQREFKQALEREPSIRKLNSATDFIIPFDEDFGFLAQELAQYPGTHAHSNHPVFSL